MSDFRWLKQTSCAALLVGSGSLQADGNSIDKVYNPYVQQLEQELEFRTLWQSTGDRQTAEKQRYKLGYGRSLTDNFFVELYSIATDESGSDFEWEAVELELKWQLSEQGEYDNDWGLLFELEREYEENIWEASTSLLVTHEWQNWIGTVNGSLIYEWGSGIDNEWETALSAQLRYRNRAEFEPALELFWSQDTHAIGPAAHGQLRLENQKKLLWSLALLAGLNDTTADASLNFSLEFEF